MAVPHSAVQSQELSAAYDGPSVETWSDRDQRIVVTQPAAGFLYDLIMRAKLVGSPDDVYAVLKDPDSHQIFRGIKDTLDRRTLEDDGKGRRKLRIKHRALTKFLWISVTFDTELYVWEDDNERTIRFTNARSDGFMKKFDGVWRVQPFTQQTLDSIYKKQPQQQESQHHRFSPAAALAGIQRFHHSKAQQQQTLVTLEQALAPRARPPGPVAHLVRGLCARVLQNMMEDLRLEVQRRQELEEAQSAVIEARTVVSKKLSAASLPIASITAAQRKSFRKCGGNSGKSSRTLCCFDREISKIACQQESGGQLLNLLASAVPLEMTVKL